MEILIIGAGAAGLAAGKTLQDAGHTVQVLEARDRIGGRVWTDRTLAGIPIERGAEFIHGDAAYTWRYLPRGKKDCSSAHDHLGATCNVREILFVFIGIEPPTQVVRENIAVGENEVLP